MIVSRWEIDRGRSYELDKNSPGTAAVTFIDINGELDPASGGYDFNPGTPAAIGLYNPVAGTDSPVFVGNVSRVDYKLHRTENYAIATLHLVDGMERIARTELYPGVLPGYTEWGYVPAASGVVQDGDTFFTEDLTGNAVATRINRVLDQFGWSSTAREIFSGNVGLLSAVYAHRTSALAPILDAADAEFPGVANVYVQKDGRFTFHGRFARFNPTSSQYHITNWTAGDKANAGSGPVIQDLEYSLDADKVINSAIALPKGIADADISAQRYENAASIAAYGNRSVSFDNLLTGFDHTDNSEKEAATLKFAEYYVDNFKDPRVQINRITFASTQALIGTTNAAAQWALLCGIDISDIITITTSRISGDYFVEGLHYTAEPMDGDFLNVTLEVDLSPRAAYGTSPF